ncbi:type II toxin-antitoxin system RelE/ParE family toxin [Oligoflexus sp.]|uniref:type II toxin-antitoxin system RelE/ParE family toxin n=1 Tax=Oligoflexus sp. TaxID=1971216 RepID=UPI0039C8F5CE
MDASERKFEVWFWVNENGEKPVARWLKSLEPADKRYLTDLLNDLAYDGPRSRPKVFKHLDGKLWEIRDLRTGAGYRIYFGFDGKSICLVVNSGDKSSQNRDIELAKQRLKSVE